MTRGIVDDVAFAAFSLAGCVWWCGYIVYDTARAVVGTLKEGRR